MGLFANVLDHFGVIFMPPGADLIGDVTYSNDMALAGRLRDERTNPGQTDDDAGVLEFAKGSARGHSRHPKMLHQFGLGLPPGSWLPFPTAYRVQHLLFDRDTSRPSGSLVVVKPAFLRRRTHCTRPQHHAEIHLHL